ncbi:uncharacterized protein LOC131017922 isoform X2 [Salvia miltiorrhiza]|uniref:uncharacterized protein LOC131017922 isoform X2 n=1 Tax=Salvia miltiorrhiza TaxID=226208 RepID=UPI0025AD415A|nr:uncharacterized protein LOC131017922 isoform X2 [Salvia miltiorrhiza]
MDQPDEGPPVLLRPDIINSTWDVGTYYKIKYLSKEQQILELQPDEFELTTMYYLSTLGFDLGRPGEEDDNQEEEPHPSGSLNDIHRARHEETPDLLFDAPIETHEVSALHDTPIGVEDIPWTGTDRRVRGSSSRDGSRGKAREKHGEQANRRVDREYIDNAVRRIDAANEARMQRHSDALHERVKGTLKWFLDEWKGLMSCKSARATDVCSPVPRPTPAPEARPVDDVRDEDAEIRVEDEAICDEDAAGLQVRQDDTVEQSPYVPQFSQFEFGNCSFLGTDGQLPHFSNPMDHIRACVDYMGEVKI